MDRPTARARTGNHLRPVAVATVASEAAAQRLSGNLRERADRYRHDASVDLTLLDALVRMDELEAAADTLEGHRQSLQALALDLQLAVADAAEERDAATSSPATAPGPAGFRRRMMTLTSAAAVMLALALPMARTLPRTILAGIEGRSAEEHDTRITSGARQAAARTWAHSRRSDAPARPTARNAHDRPDVVREPVRTPPAADVSGGSAAADHPPSGTILSLDAARAARRPPRRPAADDAVDERAPVRLLHDPQVRHTVPSQLDLVGEAADLDPS